MNGCAKKADIDSLVTETTAALRALSSSVAGLSACGSMGHAHTHASAPILPCGATCNPFDRTQGLCDPHCSSCRPNPNYRDYRHTCTPVPAHTHNLTHEHTVGAAAITRMSLVTTPQLWGLQNGFTTEVPILRAQVTGIAPNVDAPGTCGDGTLHQNAEVVLRIEIPTLQDWQEFTKLNVTLQASGEKGGALCFAALPVYANDCRQGGTMTGCHAPSATGETGGGVAMSGSLAQQFRPPGTTCKTNPPGVAQPTAWQPTYCKNAQLELTGKVTKQAQKGNYIYFTIKMCVISMSPSFCRD